jgi:hypothetical protein
MVLNGPSSGLGAPAATPPGPRPPVHADAPGVQGTPVQASVRGLALHTPSPFGAPGEMDVVGSQVCDPVSIEPPGAMVRASGYTGEDDSPHTSTDETGLQNRALRHCMVVEELQLGDMYELSGLSGVLRWAAEKEENPLLLHGDTSPCHHGTTPKLGLVAWVVSHLVCGAGHCFVTDSDA